MASSWNDVIKSRPDRGVVLRDNDLLLTPSKLLPPPETDGHLTKVFVRSNRLVQVFGRGAAGVPRTPRSNYIWFRGGTIRFGKLTMTDADLQLIDMHPADPSISTRRGRDAARGRLFEEHASARSSDLHARLQLAREVIHSCISVRAGSIRAARRAGRYAESIATVNSTIVTIRYVCGSKALIP